MVKCIECSQEALHNLEQGYNVIQCSNCKSAYIPISKVTEAYESVKDELKTLIHDLDEAKKEAIDLTTGVDGQ